MDDEILSPKKELELAEGYAINGPDEFPKEYMDRCLNNAKEMAKKEGTDISKEIERIENIWEDNCEVSKIINRLGSLAANRDIDVTDEIKKIQSKFFDWGFSE